MDPSGATGKNHAEAGKESAYLALGHLGQCVATQDGGIKLLLAKAAALEGIKDKLRSEPAKTAISELMEVLNAMEGCHKKVIMAFNDTKRLFRKEEELKRTNCDANPPKAPSTEAGTQSPCWWDIGAAPAQSMTREEMMAAPQSWTEVVRKGRSKGQTAATTEKAAVREPRLERAAGNLGKTPTPQPRNRTRPAALLVKVGAEGFLELAKKIRSGVNADVIGDSIVGVRQAKSGGLLIEIRGDQARFEAVRAEVVRSAGTEVEVHSLQQRATVEVRDLDEWTGADVVAEAVANAVDVNLDAVKILSLRKRFGGAQTALVSLPQASRGLASSGRLRVGWVNCRVRLADPKVRCFHCLAFGHMSKDCVGPDRTECCRRCGEVGHKAASCNASATAINAFAKTVDEEGRKKL